MGHRHPAPRSPPSPAVTAVRAGPGARLAQNGPVADVRHILVLPDRDAAEEVAEEITERLGLPEEPLPLREALAGEDDAEDAQWLVVVEDPASAYDPAGLDALAAEYDGWLEGWPEHGQRSDTDGARV